MEEHGIKVVEGHSYGTEPFTTSEHIRFSETDDEDHEEYLGNYVDVPTIEKRDMQVVEGHASGSEPLTFTRISSSPTWISVDRALRRVGGGRSKTTAGSLQWTSVLLQSTKSIGLLFNPDVRQKVSTILVHHRNWRCSIYAIDITILLPVPACLVH